MVSIHLSRSYCHPSFVYGRAAISHLVYRKNSFNSFPILTRPEHRIRVKVEDIRGHRPTIPIHRTRDTTESSILNPIAPQETRTCATPPHRVWFNHEHRKETHEKPLKPDASGTRRRAPHYQHWQVGVPRRL